MQPFLICCPGCGTRFSARTPAALGQTRPCPKCAAPIQIVDPNAPLTPPTWSQPWNRWALVAGTAAALVVMVAVLAFSRGGAAGPSPGRSDAVADASEPGRTEEDAAHADPPAPHDSQADPQPDKPSPPQDVDVGRTSSPSMRRTGSPSYAEAIEAEIDSALADRATDPAETAGLAPTAQPEQAVRAASAGPPPPAAPTAAERARMAAEPSPEASRPAPGSHKSILGPANDLPTLPVLAGGDGDAGDATSDDSGVADQAEQDGSPQSHAADTDQDRPSIPQADDPLYHRLHRKIVLYECEKLPLDFLAEELSELAALEVSLDYVALDRLRVDFDTPITLQLEDTSLAGILRRVVEPLELSYVVAGEKVLITAPSENQEEDDAEDGPEQAP